LPSSSRNGAGQRDGSFISSGMSGSSSEVRIIAVQSSFRRSITGRWVQPNPKISAIFYLPSEIASSRYRAPRNDPGLCHCEQSEAISA